MVLAAPFCSRFPFPKLPGQPLSQTRAREGVGGGVPASTYDGTVQNAKTLCANQKNQQKHQKPGGSKDGAHIYPHQFVCRGMGSKADFESTHTPPPPQHFLSQIFAKPRILNPLSFKARQIFCFRKKLGDK